MTQLPIFIFEHDYDLSIFESIDKAKQYLEPSDILNGEYACFDSRAKPLTLCVDEDGDIQILEGCHHYVDLRQFQRLLRGVVSQVFEGVLPEDTAVEELVKLALLSFVVK